MARSGIRNHSDTPRLTARTAPAPGGCPALRPPRRPRIPSPGPAPIPYGSAASLRRGPGSACPRRERRGSGSRSSRRQAYRKPDRPPRRPAGPPAPPAPASAKSVPRWLLLPPESARTDSSPAGYPCMSPAALQYKCVPERGCRPRLLFAAYYHSPPCSTAVRIAS